VRKVAAMEGGLVWFRGGFTAGILFQTGGLVYDNVSENEKSYRDISREIDAE